MLTNMLLLVNLAVIGFLIVFYLECVHEKETRAPKIAGTVTIIFLLLLVVILSIPASHKLLALFYGAGILCVLLLIVPPKPNHRVLQGATGFQVSDVDRVDERDVVFARLRLVPKQEEQYAAYYGGDSEKEARDAKRREKGLLGTLGSIDKGYQPISAMVHASFDIPNYLGTHAIAEPVEGEIRAQWDTAKATEIVKQYALHTGADMVGICEVNPQWVYSHRGEIHYDNWDDWDKPLSDTPKYAVVMLTEMNWDHVSAAPHTPSVAESANDYGKGAYLSTVLARWFAHMGYRGLAQNTRNYDTLLVPLAVDAGLGELGRQGYLIAPKFGARVRIFATLTDMPLIPDSPVSIGVDEFCEKCKKCAESCPSQSIPLDDKILFNGTERWKTDEDTCFEYWSKVGTDCSICMAVCPFSRPDTFSHRIVRYLLEKSRLARNYFPEIDNYLYGKRWRPRQVPAWLDYPRGIEAKKEIY